MKKKKAMILGAAGGKAMLKEKTEKNVSSTSLFFSDASRLEKR